MKKYQKQVKIPYWLSRHGENKLINPLIVSYGTSISEIVGIKETIATRIREMFIKTAAGALGRAEDNLMKLENIGLRIKGKIWNGTNGIIYNISYKITDKFDQNLYLELWNEIEIRDGGALAIGDQVRYQTLELFLNT